MFIISSFVRPASHLQPNQISMTENILVSRYINNPLLIDGELLVIFLLFSFDRFALNNFMT